MPPEFQLQIHWLKHRLFCEGRCPPCRLFLLCALHCSKHSSPLWVQPVARDHLTLKCSFIHSADQLTLRGRETLLFRHCNRAHFLLLSHVSWVALLPNVLFSHTGRLPHIIAGGEYFFPIALVSNLPIYIWWQLFFWIVSAPVHFPLYLSGHWLFS